MKIYEVIGEKRRYWDLVLLADDIPEMIERYLNRGRMFVLAEDEAVIAQCIVTDEGDGLLEIKNIAVDPAHQKKGYGKALIDFVVEYFKDEYTTLQVGTGDGPMTTPFYEACGFERHHSIKNFFTDNGYEVILEDGTVLTDMLYLRRGL